MLFFNDSGILNWQNDEKIKDASQRQDLEITISFAEIVKI